MAEFKFDTKDIKVDTANMCIDRNTELGKQFAELNASLENETNPSRKAFLQKLSAYTEAGLIIDATMPKAQAEEAKEKLRKQFEENK